VLLSAAASAGAGALLSTGAGGAHPRPGGARTAVMIPANRKQVLPLRNRTVRSVNWSGYAVTSKRHLITAVSGTFVVPKVGSPPPHGFAATWAGIGGYFRKWRDLIQAGTAEDSNTGGRGGRRYFAWYELPRNSEQQLHHCTGDRRCRVKPGERIAVKIRNVGPRAWVISVTDAGHWGWRKQVSYRSSRSSAEWILEAPKVGMQTTTLAPVGSVHFGPVSRFNRQSSSRTIVQGRPVKIILTGEAKPSALAANGQSFNDCAYRASCPRP
jgi:hypothetical protein